MTSRVTLVTGAAGFAGSHLLDLLTDSGADSNHPWASPKPGEGGKPDPTRIVAWYRPGGTPLAHGSAVTWDAVDLLDRPSVVNAIARLRPAMVYHCAGAAHVGRAWEQTEATLAINVRGTHHLLEGLSRLAPGRGAYTRGSPSLTFPSA